MPPPGRPKSRSQNRATPGAAPRRAPREQALYRALFKNMPIPLQSVDENARLLAVNSAWLKLLGYSRKEVIGQPLSRFYMPESARDLHDRGWPLLLEKGEVHHLERRLRCKSGDVVTVLVSGSIERDSARRFLRGYGALIDITQSRKLERERDRYFEMSQDFLTIAEFDGRIRDVNPAVVTTFGRSREEMLAARFWEFIHPDDHPLVEAELRRLAAGAPVVETEVRYRHRDGSWHWSVWRSTAAAEEGVVYSVGRDVHEQRAAEETLRRAERLEAIGQLTGGIAHDFNNLLTIVIGNLDRIASSRSADERVKHLAEAALEGAERGARLTEHLLVFARRQRLEPQVLRLDEVVRRMAPLYRRAVGETIELTFAPAAKLWRLSADPGRLETTLLNLILNARDAMPAGGRLTIAAANLSLAAQQIPDLAAGEYVVITVKDTGSGMPPETLARAFEPFFSTKPVGQGSGLGLSMVYGFARQSGGTARIESSPGAGTTVSLYLPRADEEAAVEPRAEPPSVRRDKRAATVLVVEDEAAVRQITADLLSDLGHRVLVAGDGVEALAVLSKEPKVDLLISDVVMPGGIDGAALATMARQSRPELRVLLVTGYGFGSGGEGSGSAGFEVLRKPYRPSQLSAKVEEVLAGPAEGGSHPSSPHADLSR
jgi:PAS domain S-box-containing protein